MKTLISQQNFNNFNKNLNISVEFDWSASNLQNRAQQIFLSQSIWVQGVLCYDQNWWKLKYLSRIIEWQILSKKWFRLAQKGQFWSFCRFFHLFPPNEVQIDSEWPISPDSQLFFCHQSISFLEKSQKFSFHGEGYISKCFQFFNFFKSFHTKAAQNDP